MPHIIEKGSGPPLVLVPGIQGRWEYMRPTVDALAQFFHVITFPLSGRGFDDYVAQVACSLDDRQIERAILCGVSFGGLVAARFSAAHGNRTAALVLASTPGPGFRLRPRHDFYARLPWIFGPLFVAEAPIRLRREIVAAFPDRGARWRFAAAQLRTVMKARLPLTEMAIRARLLSTIDMVADCERIDAPTLIVTGDPALDFVVSVDGSSRYTRLIRNSRQVVLERTGHIGSITRPDAFAAIVREFVEDERHAAA